MPISNLVSALTALVNEESWCGTATEMRAALAANGVPSVMTPARLSHLLRQLEAELYWRDIRVRFRRKPGLRGWVPRSVCVPGAAVLRGRTIRSSVTYRPLLGRFEFRHPS